MPGPTRDLARLALPVVCLVLLLGLFVGIAVESLVSDSTLSWWMAVNPLILIWILCHKEPHEWQPVRLWWYARRMRTATAEGVRIHYTPEIERIATAAQLVEMFRAELNDLLVWLCVKPPEPIVVFVLPSDRSLVWVSGCGHLGWANTRVNHIIVGAENVASFRWQVRHELTHILADPQGAHTPELKSEGLAVFFQLLVYGVHDIRPFPLWRPENAPPLRSLLTWETFHDQNSSLHYAAAGAFTAFLICKFGWPTYWVFYQVAQRENFTDAFFCSFGASLEAVELEWYQTVEATPLGASEPQTGDDANGRESSPGEPGA